MHSYKMGVVYPTVGANCVRPPAGHSEPTGEESRFTQGYFVLLEILRFAQDDKWGFVGVFLERTKYRIRVGRGLAPAAGFALNYGTDKL